MTDPVYTRMESSGLVHEVSSNIESDYGGSGFLMVCGDVVMSDELPPPSEERDVTCLRCLSGEPWPRCKDGPVLMSGDTLSITYKITINLGVHVHAH